MKLRTFLFMTLTTTVMTTALVSPALMAPVNGSTKSQTVASKQTWHNGVPKVLQANALWVTNYHLNRTKDKQATNYYVRYVMHTDAKNNVRVAPKYFDQHHNFHYFGKIDGSKASAKPKYLKIGKDRYVIKSGSHGKHALKEVQIIDAKHVKVWTIFSKNNLNAFKVYDGEFHMKWDVKN